MCVLGGGGGGEVAADEMVDAVGWVKSAGEAASAATMRVMTAVTTRGNGGIARSCCESTGGTGGF